jgi:phage portal protein BeeE
VQFPAVWACLRYLSQTVAMLPWNVIISEGRGAEVQEKHPVQWLICTRRPNPEWSSFQFRETLVHWALRWGNGYAEIERDLSAGRSRCGRSIPSASRSAAIRTAASSFSRRQRIRPAHRHRSRRGYVPHPRLR